MIYCQSKYAFHSFAFSILLLRLSVSSPRLVEQRPGFAQSSWFFLVFVFHSLNPIWPGQAWAQSRHGCYLTRAYGHVDLVLLATERNVRYLVAQATNSVFFTWMMTLQPQIWILRNIVLQEYCTSMCFRQFSCGTLTQDVLNLDASSQLWPQSSAIANEKPWQHLPMILAPGVRNASNLGRVNPQSEYWQVLRLWCNVHRSTFDSARVVFLWLWHVWTWVSKATLIWENSWPGNQEVECSSTMGLGYCRGQLCLGWTKALIVWSCPWRYNNLLP